MLSLYEMHPCSSPSLCPVVALLLCRQLLPTPLSTLRALLQLTLVTATLQSSRLRLVAEGVRRNSAVITRPTALHQSFLQNMLVHYSQVKTLCRPLALVNVVTFESASLVAADGERSGSLQSLVPSNTQQPLVLVQALWLCGPQNLQRACAGCCPCCHSLCSGRQSGTTTVALCLFSFLYHDRHLCIASLERQVKLAQRLKLLLWCRKLLVLFLVHASTALAVVIWHACVLSALFLTSKHNDHVTDVVFVIAWHVLFAVTFV